MPPIVSVIIPNYNHARYLPQRIESVLKQTFKDIEVILMDDCSTDDSRTIIAEYASHDIRILTVLNEHNSGSTFKQWNKGIALAKGEYIWIAESDDYAEPDFLKITLDTIKADSNIGLVYCDSITVDDKGDILGEMKSTLNRILNTKVWNNDFAMTGIDFIKSYMVFTNVIPNASAVLLRKQAVDKVGPADSSMRLAGDWLYWSKILSVSNVIYMSKPLNYFRTHTASVRSKTVKNGILLVETSQVMLYIKSVLPNELFNPLAIKAFFDDWIWNYKNGNIPFLKNFTIAKNINKIEEGKLSLLRKFLNFAFGNNLKGVRDILKIK